MDWRYSDRAQRFDDDLGIELTDHRKAAAEKAESKKAPSHDGLGHIAEGRTPLDEVKAAIEASKHKTSAEEIAEHRVRRKLAELRDRGRHVVQNFLNAIGAERQ